MKKMMLLFIFLFSMVLTLPVHASDCPSDVQFSQKLKEAFATLYGPKIKDVFKEAVPEACHSPLQGKDWKIVVMKVRFVDNRGNKRYVPITTIFLNGKFYLIPAFVSLEDARNYALIWSINMREQKDIPHDEAFLIYGNPRKCKNSLEIFSDPECPFCQRFVPEFIELAKKKDMCIYHYCYPLKFHKNAEKYCKMMAVTMKKLPPEKRVDFLLSFYEATKKKEDPTSLAQNASGLSENEFYKAVLDENEPTLVEEIALKAGVRGTPTVFVNKRQVPNQVVKEYLDTLK